MGCTELQREQMDDDQARPILYKVKAGCCPEMKDNTDHSPQTRYWDLLHKRDILALFSRLIIHEVGKPLCDGGSMTGGFSE
jgi:hypothetical protein